ncbi:hypothetical protein OESDEN_24574 [Oesophagostomum dentatum]|uniref:glucuronosyltransferase n=1 Tax=Oesophagostomum dentatum TaxID=61180 RepID=A0A0B1RT08_OESDE|nr:hypothetical protein OESDEN_24574 [Oesophagostomum dentatum]
MGKPAVMVPLFADQTRNANMLARHGGAIVLQKHDLADSSRVAEAIQNIVSDSKYSKSAKLLAEILAKQPITPKQLLLKHAEFAARFGKLPNLDPYGRHLSTIQYYLIDVFSMVVVVSVAVTYAIYRLIRMLCRLILRKVKTD